MNKNILIAVAVVVVGFLLVGNPSQPRKAIADDKPDSKFTPVDNMHHFMEYISEPVYQSLEASLKEQPKDKRAWGEVKSGALILAETAGLVAQRGDNSKDADWQSSSLAVHQEGKKLYQAARAKDYESAKMHFKSMTAGCASCHEKYR